MNNEDIFDGITDIREDLLPETPKKTAKIRKYRPLLTTVAAVLALTLLVGVLYRPREVLPTPTSPISPPSPTSSILPTTPILPPATTSPSIALPLGVHALATARYPQMAPYPGPHCSSEEYDAWWADLDAQRNQRVDAGNLEPFFTESAALFLTGDGEENRLYSPLNVYMALAMLAEATDGSSRQQILDLLGHDDLDGLRSQAKGLWNANYRKDGLANCVLAGSVWLDEDLDYHQTTLDTLADSYYASVFSGEMGSQELNQALQAWLAEQTGGLLRDQTDKLTLPDDTVLSIATTILYQAQWSRGFSDTATTQEIFHSPDGDMNCSFMHGEEDGYYEADGFRAVSKELEIGQMWFLLPDPGKSPQELLQSGSAMDFLLHREMQTYHRAVVRLAVPKFDISSKADLLQGLKGLGLTDILDPNTANFGGITEAPAFLSQATHGVRLAIDEEGCVATAYTVLGVAGSAPPPPEQVDFILDRPFVFAVTGTDGLPLFLGTVYNPA